MPSMNIRDMALEMLVSQLMAAKVYAAFLRWGHASERKLWSAMLKDELTHGAYLARVQGTLADDVRVTGREVHLSPFRHVSDLAMWRGQLSAVQRIALALRLEHAEMDFGLESLALSPSSHESLALFGERPPFEDSLEDHYRRLIKAALPYRAAPEVSKQLVRIFEHFPCLETEEGLPDDPDGMDGPESREVLSDDPDASDDDFA